MQRYGWGVLLALGFAGCGLFKSEGPSTNPLEFVRKDAEVVIQLRDMSMLIELRKTLTQQFSGVVSPAEISQMQGELTLALGFDPTTEKGLKGVGLATKGPVAAELLADGTGAVWAVPVDKPKTLAPVIETIMKARTGVDEAKTETKDGVSVTSLLVEFGPRKVVRAAHATARGHFIIGFGPKAVDLVVRAVKVKPTESIRQNPEFKTLASRLGAVYDVRMISPAGNQALAAAADRLGRRSDVQAMKPMLEKVLSAGWTARYDGGVIKGDALARLNDAGQAQAKKIFAVKGVAPKGVTALDLSRAVVFVQAAGDPQALLDTLAPAGSRQRAQIESGVQRVKSDLEIDLLGDVLPNLSGHAALVLGTGDLSEVEFKEIVGNPFGLIWTAFSASARDAAALAQLESKLEGRLKERQVQVNARKVGASEIREVVPMQPRAGSTDPLFSTFTHAGAWGFSVEPVVADAIAKNSTGVDRLQGAPGVHVELRVARLSAELRRFKVRELPIIYRALVVKMLDYLSLVDRVTMKVEPAGDSLRMKGDLRFSSRISKAP